MHKPSNKMIIRLIPGSELRLRQVAEPQTDDEPTVFQLVWWSLRTTCHFANLYYHPSAPFGSSRYCYTADLLDERGTVCASIPLHSFSMRDAALEVVETKICF